MLVSSLVVMFAVVEVLILPFLAQTFLWQEPLVAGAWMGLAIKTDGAAVAGGGITEALILAQNAAEGIKYQPGWILGTTATVKVFIDIFIGIWAFVLGYIWTNHINRRPRQGEARAKSGSASRSSSSASWSPSRSGSDLALGDAGDIAAKVPAAIGEANTFRVIFFILTFFSIGVLSNFKQALAGRHRQARRRLFRQPVRLRDLGRAADFLAVLQRRQAATGKLTKEAKRHAAIDHRERIRNAASRATAAGREEADRLELRHRRRAAGRACHRQSTVPGVDLTPRNTRRRLCRRRNGNEYVANSEDRAVRRRGDRSPQPRRRHGERRSSAPGSRAFWRVSTRSGRPRWRRTCRSARPAEPLTIVYASESGNSEKLAGDIAKAARKNGLKPTLVDMADLELAAARDRQAAGRDRRDLGRRRAAGARRARLQRTDGRGRAAPRRRRVRRAGAGRHGLCGVLRHRQGDRRAAWLRSAASASSIASIAISILPSRPRDWIGDAVKALAPPKPPRHA